MKRWKSRLMILAAAVCLLTTGVWAAEASPEETPVPGSAAGENLLWELKDGTLTVSGSGPMYDFPEGAPWEGAKGEIRSVQLQGGVTYVGANAFRDCDSLENLNLGTSLTEVGASAFSSCDGLKTVDLPRTFRVFGEESFSHCSNLTEFRFEGSMPSFRLNCLWDTQAKLIYPAGNPWPLQHIEQLEGAFQGRIEFLASDGTDPYEPQAEQPEAARPAPTEAPTEPPVQPPTEAPTQPPATQPPVVTAPPTEAPTEPAETRPEVPVLTESETEFVELPEPQKPGMGVGTVILIVVMALSGVGILVMAGVLVHSRIRLTQEDFPDPSMNLRPRKQAEEKAPESRVRTGRDPGPSAGEKKQAPAEKVSEKPEAPKAGEKKGGKYSR